MIPTRVRAWLQRNPNTTASEGNATQNVADTCLLPTIGTPSSRGPDGRIRSVVFLHQSYYHFYYLAAALRRRGWDAIAVSFESPTSANAKFYHGEDVNLFASERKTIQDNAATFVEEASGRFRWLQFAGDGMMCVSPWDADTTERRDVIPWDFLKLKQAGVRIGYSAGGCTDGIAQSSFYAWSERSCDFCELRERPEFCSDRRNLAWGHKRNMICDLVATEMLPMLDYGSGEKVFAEPLTFAVDSSVWRPDLIVPPHLHVEKSEGEVIVYHGVGNYYDPHYGGLRDYKGTQAIMTAVEELKSEGLPVRMLFVHNVPSSDIRFVQVQADIVVDQLRFGRYGATGRESLMLGRPLVGFLNATEPNKSVLRSVSECPIVNVTTDTIKDELRRLVQDPHERTRLGHASRRFAERWHSADALAARFEAVYDHVLAGRPVAEAPLVLPGD